MMISSVVAVVWAVGVDGFVSVYFDQDSCTELAEAYRLMTSHEPPEERCA